MKTLLIIPPLTQLNTPYPSTAYLKSFLNTNQFESTQKDLGLDLILKLFSPQGLEDIRSCILKSKSKRTDSIVFFLEAFDDYKQTILPVINFLQGNDLSLAVRIATRKLVPEGPRFLHLQEHAQILDLFGTMGTQDQAKHIASLYLDDLADVIREGVDSKFEFSKYGEKLASSQNSYDTIYNQLHATPGLIETYLFEIIDDYMKYAPDVVGWTLPFPGNVYGALVCSQYIKTKYPHTKTVIGGGYVNTELRELSDPRLFEIIDYAIFDDGEKPFLNLLNFLDERVKEKDLLRTAYLKNDAVLKSNFNSPDIGFKDIPAPSYEGLDFKRYLSMLEMPNPMHRMWSDFKWNKLILAHGCYWKKCTFCDTSLDYIQRFEPQKAETILNYMKDIRAKTGSSGFHFVDEAAPPALLKSLSQKIIETREIFSWWGNIRFDPFFNQDVTQLMADAGCVAVTGGLEVASPRLLKLINKGVSLENVARVAKSFKNAGVYVHAYLMYGFPTQTELETINSLEVVRQLFKNQCLDSAYWHRFVATVHSPVGKNPSEFQIQIQKPNTTDRFFAINEIPFYDPLEVDHDFLGVGLRKALYNYMHGIGLDEDVRVWFEDVVPKTTLPKNYIAKILAEDTSYPLNESHLHKNEA